MKASRFYLRCENSYFWHRVLLIPLVGAVWKSQVRKNQFNVLLIIRKTSKVGVNLLFHGGRHF